MGRTTPVRVLTATVVASVLASAVAGCGSGGGSKTVSLKDAVAHPKEATSNCQTLLGATDGKSVEALWKKLHGPPDDLPSGKAEITGAIDGNGNQDMRPGLDCFVDGFAVYFGEARNQPAGEAPIKVDNQSVAAWASMNTMGPDAKSVLKDAVGRLKP